MYLCYIDESGVSSIPGNSSHFILAGLAIPIWHWKSCDRDISQVKKRYGLEGREIHTAWILRKYIEQSKIRDFQLMDYSERRDRIAAYRQREIYRLQRSNNPKHHRQTKKNYAKTDAYIHLTWEERRQFIHEVAQCLKGWGFARLFGECVDKTHYSPTKNQQSIDEQTLDQVVSRFEQFLKIKSATDGTRFYGLLIHDNNETVAKRHTDLMITFHEKGTQWVELEHIIETPLFVDSELTSLIQIADLCAYSIRRYVENDERDLFELIYDRADRRGSTVVGLRHFTNAGCTCLICQGHNS